MKFVSLFTGIGGLDLGLERAGWECVAQVEWDDYCTAILEKHWPDVPKWRDIHDLSPESLPYADAVVGGFPCQPVSLAGKREAQNDERWLWPEFFRIVRAIRPRIVLVENVPGLTSAGMGDVLGDLAQVGYDTEWQSVPAAAVGAPHLRWRIFIVAYPQSSRLERRRDGQRRTVGRRSGTKTTFTGNGDSVHHPMADAASSRLERHQQPNGPSPQSRWLFEPDVGRVAYGIPHRVDRLKGLGNAVVPQVAEWIGHMINQTEEQ